MAALRRWRARDRQLVAMPFPSLFRRSAPDAALERSTALGGMVSTIL